MPHIQYKVSLRYRDGSVRDVKTVTNRGPHKAVYLATRSVSNPFATHALDVEVTQVGPPEVDADGVPVLEGFAADRNEW